MADTSTIASLATAGGTLVLAVATFASTALGQPRGAHVRAGAEGGDASSAVQCPRRRTRRKRSDTAMITGCVLRDGLAAVQEVDGQHLLRDAAAQRRIGHRRAARLVSVAAPRRDGRSTPGDRANSARRRVTSTSRPATSASGRRRCATRRTSYTRRCARRSQRAMPLSVDLLYGDHEGGQRTITRFYMVPRSTRR